MQGHNYMYVHTYVGSNPFELVNVLLEYFINFLLKPSGLVHDRQKKQYINQNTNWYATGKCTQHNLLNELLCLHAAATYVKTYSSESLGQEKLPMQRLLRVFLHIQPLLKTEQQNSLFCAFNHFTVVLNGSKMV